MNQESRMPLINILKNDNFTAVIEYSAENNVPPDEALNQIVSEWAGGKKIEPLKVESISTNLSEIEKRLRGIEIKLDCVNSTVENIDFEITH